MIFSQKSPIRLDPSQPLIQWVSAAILLCIKQLEREADLSPPSSVEIKNDGSHSSTLAYAHVCFMFYIFL
jgi:hypothetical protein